MSFFCFLLTLTSEWLWNQLSAPQRSAVKRERERKMAKDNAFAPVKRKKSSLARRNFDS